MTDNYNWQSGAIMDNNIMYCQIVVVVVVVVVDSVGNATLPRDTLCCICIDIQYLLLSLCEFTL